MGCDGGTIPKRDELVRKKKRPEQKDKDSELSFRWKYCSITQQPLQKPVVACGLGRLYSKDAVIEALLDRANLLETAQHIKNLKDIKDLNLTPNPSYKSSAEKGDAYIDRQTAPYICPVIGLEMNGKFRFVFLWSCGCVMSERALKEVKTKLCHKCQQPFVEEDIVVLNGSTEDLELMVTRMEARQAHLKAKKKAKSETKSKGKTEKEVSATTEAAETVVSNSSNETKINGNTRVSINGDAHNLKIKLQNEKPDQKLPSKLGSKLNDIKAAKRAASNSDIEDPRFKKTKGTYSVANDPKASEVFKSIFTSHEKAQHQNKAHWITYNPFYN